LWFEPDPEAVHNLQLLRVNDVDVVGAQVRHIDAGKGAGHGWAQMAGACLAVEIARIRDRRHPRKALGFDAV
jgi:hypothetical protein